jgi:acyl-coenzyme A thioesterase PaaI-like protein
METKRLRRKSEKKEKRYITLHAANHPDGYRATIAIQERDFAMTAIQDRYPSDFGHCFGCGSRNFAGHRLKSFVEAETVVAHFTPAPHHMSVPGFVYGGLLASLVDCHAMATAASAEISGNVAPRFVTAMLHVEYLKPTPLGPELEIRGHVTERGSRKAIVDLTVSAGGIITVRANVVAVRIPKSMES